MSVSTNGTQRYTLGPVKSWVYNAAYIIGPMFGIKTIYGWRKTDPFPDHPSGHALDFMTPNKATGDALAAYVIQNHVALGVKYLIWYRQYWSPSTGWEPYTQPGQGPHTDHVHVTFLDTPGSATAGGTPTGLSDTGSSSISTATAALPVGSDETCAWTIGVGSLVSGCVLSKIQVRQTFGVMILGSACILGVISIGMLLVYGLGKSGIPLPSQASTIARYLGS